MKKPKLTAAVIRSLAPPQSFQRGQELCQSGALSSLTRQETVIRGLCEGTSSPFYQVSAELDGGGVRTASCNCPYELGGYCKHIVALLLAYAHDPQQFIVRQDLRETLATLNQAQLLALLTRLLQERTELRDWIEAALTTPSISGQSKAPVAKHKKVNVDVYRRRVRGIMHSLDHMRASEAYWHVGGLTDELRGVGQTALEFLNAGDGETALQILLTLIEESQDGFEYVDDSNGELGDFFDEIGETLAEVILSLDLNEAERESLLIDLDEFHSHLSDYGVEGLSVAIAAARDGWNETPQQEQTGYSQDDDDDEDEDDEYEDDEDEDDEWEEEDEEVPRTPHYGWSPTSPSQALTRIKLRVLERQGRTEEYLKLSLTTGSHLQYAQKLVALNRVADAATHALKNLMLAEDALKLAEQLREANHLDEALRLGEKGLKLGGYKAALGSWLAPIEEAQGRTKQAIEAWRATFREAPSLEIWQTLQRLSGKGWNRVKPELLTVLKQGWNKQPLAEILLHEQEWDAALQVADQETYDYRLIALVADALIPHRPEWVIRASIKQFDGLVAKTQSKYYVHAAEWLRRVKAAYTQLKQPDKWQKYLEQLKEQYRRRPALMSYLKAL